MLADQVDQANISVDSGPLNGAERDAWIAFVSAQPRGTLFHLPNWSEAMRNAHGHRAVFLRCNEHGKLSGILPLTEIKSRLFGHAMISNAFAVGGGPLATNDRASAALVDEAIRVAAQRGAGYVELRDSADLLPGWEQRSDLYSTFERPMDRVEEANLLQIPRKQRAVVRKALGGDFGVTIDHDVGTFFQLFARTARDHGTPVFAKRHFQSLVKAFPDQCDILTVRRNGVAISSVLSFYFRNRVMPYYTGSLPEARNLGTNDLMYWKLMRHGVSRGCEIFDFGRSKVGTGPFSFKKNWGFEPHPVTHQFKLLSRRSLPNVSPANPKYANLVRLWRMLPLPVANAASSLISRNLG